MWVLSAAERHLELSTSNAASHPAHAAPVEEWEEQVLEAELVMDNHE